MIASALTTRTTETQRGLLPQPNTMVEDGAIPSSWGGVDATSRKCREASFVGADGVVTRGNSFTAWPPRLRRLGGFATFSYGRSHPSSRGGDCLPQKSAQKTRSDRPVIQRHGENEAVKIS